MKVPSHYQKSTGKGKLSTNIVDMSQRQSPKSFSKNSRSSSNIFNVEDALAKRRKTEQDRELREKQESRMDIEDIGTSRGTETILLQLSDHRQKEL